MESTAAAIVVVDVVSSPPSRPPVRHRDHDRNDAGAGRHDRRPRRLSARSPTTPTASRDRRACPGKSAESAERDRCIRPNPAKAAAKGYAISSAGFALVLFAAWISEVKFFIADAAKFPYAEEGSTDFSLNAPLRRSRPAASQPLPVPVRTMGITS